eukprot:comp21913_c0_seq1/m.31470 comp21913_c0_seq1/g.31470  ORF comp21913_c0_seq1/g.31470 comp21913_c0_seq1/m.31470 type:complete len:353 (-) comp21913_c0_seq1:503-1561(-)
MTRFATGLLVATVASTAAAAVTLQVPGDVEFMEFTKENNKNYKSEKEYELRKKIYHSNRKMVEWLNSRNEEDAEYRLNHLADLQPEDFLMSLNEPGPPYDRSDYLPKLDTKDLPAEWDWREHGAVSDVRNQGSIGSCWAFSAAGNIEGVSYVKHNKMVPVSVEQMVECDALDCGAFGGWPSLAYQYAMKSGGLVSWDSLPYCAGDASGCMPCMAPKYNKTMCGDHSDLTCDRKRNICNTLSASNVAAKVTSWGVIEQDEEQIKAALVKYGPISVAIDATMLQFYFKGIWNPIFCSRLNHAVLIVGYGTAMGKDYWIVKNSWSANWGESGYFRMIRGKAKCGIATAATTAFVE